MVYLRMLSNNWLCIFQEIPTFLFSLVNVQSILLHKGKLKASERMYICKTNLADSVNTKPQGGGNV